MTINFNDQKHLVLVPPNDILVQLVKQTLFALLIDSMVDNIIEFTTFFQNRVNLLNQTNY